MAGTGAWPTQADVASRLDPEGNIPVIAEMMSQSNDYAGDVPWIEANGFDTHQFTFRTSIPAGSWRNYNMGVPSGKSTTARGRVGMAMLEDYSMVDRALAEHSGNQAAFRRSEDVAFLEGMSQTIAQTFWYGNTTVNPSTFMGFSTFYNTISTATAQNAANVINGGGTGSSNTSIWLVGWGMESIFAVFPMGSKAGLAMEDKGDVVPGYDSVGNRFEAYTSWFRQQAGLVPKDWRYAARIANLDTTTAGLAGPNPPDLFKLMAQAVMLMPTTTKAMSGITETDDPRGDIGKRFVWYGNRTSLMWMDIQSIRDRNVLLTIDDYAGKPVRSWRDFPVKCVDQILTTEAALT